jgi:hypothetical protein
MELKKSKCGIFFLSHTHGSLVEWENILKEVDEIPIVP